MPTVPPPNIFPSAAEPPAAQSHGPPASAAAGAYSVSPGDFKGLCRDGEIDPSVTLDWAPGESRSSMATGGHQETPAAAMSGTMPAAGSLDATDCIHEIFYFARLLCAQARLQPGQFAPGMVAVCEDIKQRDALPMFLTTMPMNALSHREN